jgi:hypothetical protein
MSVEVTSRVRKNRKTNDDRYVATDRFVELTMRFDITGGKTSATQRKIESAVTEVAEQAVKAFESNSLELAAVSGSWSFCYGPWYEGEIKA